MTTFLIALHVTVSIFLIAVVLLQRGKGAEMGAVFGGGGSTTVFGSRGAGNFLTRLTTGAAVVFMLTSLGLSYSYTADSSDRLFNEPIETETAPGTAPEKPLFEEVGKAPAESAAAAEPVAPAAAEPVAPAAAEPVAPAAAEPVAPAEEVGGLPALPEAAAPGTQGD
jgi:preprotein translocase subunit SecG